MRIIQLDSIFERTLWTFRSWLWGYPISLDLRQWELSDPNNTDAMGREMRTAFRSWKFLEPFFASRGYALYRNRPTALGSLVPAPAPSGPNAHIEPSHPFAHRVYKDDIEAEFAFMVNVVFCGFTWALTLLHHAVVACVACKRCCGKGRCYQVTRSADLPNLKFTCHP